MTHDDARKLAEEAIAAADTAGLALCVDGDDPHLLFFAHYATETAATVPDPDNRAYILRACNDLPTLARALLSVIAENEKMAAALRGDERRSRAWKE